jgi:hypothetical protein
VACKSEAPVAINDCLVMSLIRAPILVLAKANGRLLSRKYATVQHIGMQKCSFANSREIRHVGNASGIFKLNQYAQRIQKRGKVRSVSHQLAAAPLGQGHAPPKPPTWRQLRILALRAAIPMVGFGFMDNLVMIEAGENIDLAFGVTFALLTLTAAGFGQCVSDVAGLTCGGMVDAFVSKMNLPYHGLAPAQLHTRISRIYSTVGGR